MLVADYKFCSCTVAYNVPCVINFYAQTSLSFTCNTDFGSFTYNSTRLSSYETCKFSCQPGQTSDFTYSL